MIKPLNSVSNVNFKGGLEDYQQQIKNKMEPKYNLTVSQGSNPPAKKPSLKRGVANIFKGFNNVTGIASGAVKGTAKGLVFGSIAGVIAKNLKDARHVIENEAGKKVKTIDFKGFAGGTFNDLFKFVGNTFKAIPEVFSKSPIDSLKSLGELPKKYMEYLGKGNKGVKAAAIGVAALTLGYNIIKSKIHANRKNADIEHSWNLNHQ